MERGASKTIRYSLFILFAAALLFTGWPSLSSLQTSTESPNKKPAVPADTAKAIENAIRKLSGLQEAPR